MWHVCSSLFIIVCVIRLDLVCSSRGVVAALIRAQSSPNKYDGTLLVRNKAIQEHLYWKGVDSSAVDVVLFHEGNLPYQHQQYIQAATPEMPVKFVDVGSVFREYRDVNVTLCPQVLMIKQMFGRGYRSMCFFWFLRFRDFIKEYDWMLRIDDDCVLARNVRYELQHMPPTVHFASCLWLDLSKGTSDAIRPENEGGVVVGMRNLTITYARERGLFQDIHSWHAPYTNVMYIDMNWLRSSAIVTGYMQKVEDSQCILSGRWGDLPLWGAAIYLTKEPRYQLKFPYYHGSHNMLVNGSHSKAPQDIVRV